MEMVTSRLPMRREGFAAISLTTFDYFYVDYINGGRTDHETLHAVTDDPTITVTMVGPVPV